MIEVGSDLLDHAVVYGLQYLLLWICCWSEMLYIARHRPRRANNPQSDSDGQTACQSSHASRWFLATSLILATLASALLVIFREVNESDAVVSATVEVLSMLVVFFLQVYSAGWHVDHVFLFSFWTLRFLALSMDVLEFWGSYDILLTFFALGWLLLCGAKSLACPQQSRIEPNLIRKLLFSWLDPLYREGHRKSASFYEEGKAFHPLPDDRRCETLLEWFRNPTPDKSYSPVPDGQSNNRELTIGKLLTPFRSKIAFTGFNRLVLIVFYFLFSYLLSVLLEPNQSQTVQKWIVTAMFGSSIAIALLNAQYQHETRDVGLRIKSLLMGMVYECLLKEVPPEASSATLTTDTGAFVTLMQDLHMMWSGPVIILGTLGALWWIIGPSALVGLAIMVAAVGCMEWIARRLTVQQAQIKRAKDVRVKLTTDSIEQVQQIKSDQLERTVEQRIGEHRAKELSHTQKSIWYEAAKHLVSIVTPMVVAYGTFLFMELIGSGSLLTVQSMFVAISLFNITRYPMSVIPTLLTSWKDTQLSLQRINVFIEARAKTVPPIQQPNGSLNESQRSLREVSVGLSDIVADHQVRIDGGQFSIKDRVVLHNIKLKLLKQTLTAVYGTHASGKTSLLRAIIGSIPKTAGTLSVPWKRISYCQQTPWLHSGTVQSNILFGEPFDGDRYQRVIHACCLEEDLQSFAGGDGRMVGEGGHALSGGQAARVSLARAIYRKDCLYLFDDPLKSLDANVARMVFERVFDRSHGLLKECTCVFVSHNPNHLQVADTVVVMKEGTIAYSRSPSLSDEQLCIDRPSEEQLESEAKPTETRERNVRNRLKSSRIRSEPSGGGKDSLKLYLDFGRLLGWFYCTALVALEAVVSALDIYITILLAQQKQNGLLAAGLLVLLWSACLFIKTGLLQLCGLSLAGSVHTRMLSTVLRQRLEFFDQNDSGVIVNRFANDLNILDAKIVTSVRAVLTSSFGVLATLALFVYKLSGVYLLFVIVLVSAILLLCGLSRLLGYHLRVARTLKRLESSSRSPIVLQYNETVQGIDTIKAFGAEERFFRQFLEKVDRHQNYVYHNLAASRWIGIRLEFIGAIVIYFVTLLIVTYQSLVGLTFVAIIVSYILRLIPSLNGLLLAAGQLEENMISFERVSQYLNLPRESLEDDGGIAFPTQGPNREPVRGPIVFHDFSLTHADGSMVLHNITLTIGAGEKLAIIGRTGAGKSSLVGALFRFYPKHTSGYILIDGVDLAQISLKSLRRALALVPQSTTLLTGRVRSFIDPHNVHPNDRLTATLQLCMLENVALDAPLEELSVGQRQLMCMVRGLLYDRPIVVLDEATSALDESIERLMLRLIQEHFHDRTVLMIAHRLNTVRSCDRILWLQDGRIHKLASPADFTEHDWSVLQRGE